MYSGLGVRNAAGRVVNAADFTQSFAAYDDGYFIHPNGIIDQTINVSAYYDGYGFQYTNVILPLAYPGGHLDLIISFLGSTPPLGIAICVTNGAGLYDVTVTTNSAGLGFSGYCGCVIRTRGF